MFAVPFSYTFPAGISIKASVDHSGFYQFRHSIGGDEYDRGVIVRAVTGGRKDPCSETSAPRPLEDVDAFVDYFKTIPTLTIDTITDASVDGHPGKTVLIRFQPPTASCADVWLWAEPGSITQNSSGRGPVRVALFDVRGVHVAILTLGPASWYPSADSLIASIRFDPSPSPDPS